MRRPPATQPRAPRADGSDSLPRGRAGSGGGAGRQQAIRKRHSRLCSPPCTQQGSALEGGRCSKTVCRADVNSRKVQQGSRRCAHTHTPRPSMVVRMCTMEVNVVPACRGVGEN